MMGETMAGMPLGNETLEFNQESITQDLDSFKERITRLKDTLEENKTLSTYSKDDLERQEKQIDSLNKTLKYLLSVFRNIKNTKTRLDNNNFNEKLKRKKIREGKRMLKGLVKQFGYIGLTIYKLEKEFGIEMKTDMDKKVSSKNNNHEKRKTDILKEIEKLQNKRKREKVDILEEIKRLRQERLKNEENIRKEIEDAKQRDIYYYKYMLTGGKEPSGKRERVRLSYWLIRSTKKIGVSYQEKIDKYISAATLNPEKYRDKVIRILSKRFGKIKWSKWNFRTIDFLGKNNNEKQSIIRPIKKSFLRKCVKDELKDYDYGRTLEIVEELQELGMIKEIKEIERYLEKEKRFSELQEIQITRLYSNIFVKKSNGLVTSFSIKYDFYDNGEIEDCLVVFVDENHQKIFLNTPKGKKQAQKAEIEYKNSDFVKQREKEEYNSIEVIYI